MKDEEKKGWAEYIAKTKHNPARPLLIKAITYVTNKNSALDLGAGALMDSKFLSKQGFKHVTAVDQANIGQEIYDTLPQDKIQYVISSYENFNFLPDHYDLINAQFALPFNPLISFNQVFEKIKNSLKTGGIFSGQLFGDQDTWKTTKPEMTFHTREEVERLLSDLEIIELEEEEKDQKPAVGELKHWHIFHIIARKK